MAWRAAIWSAIGIEIRSRRIARSQARPRLGVPRPCAVWGGGGGGAGGGAGGGRGAGGVRGAAGPGAPVGAATVAGWVAVPATARGPWRAVASGRRGPLLLSRGSAAVCTHYKL